MKTGYRNIQVFKPPVIPNSVPVLSELDSVVFAKLFFESAITASDADFELGDVVSKIEVLEKPSWLQAEYFETDGTMRLWGTPEFSNEGDTVIILKAYDAVSSTIKIYPISVEISIENGVVRSCPGSSTQLDISLPGKGPWNLLQLNSEDTVRQDQIQVSTFIITVQPSTNTPYRILATSSDGIELDTTIVMLIEKPEIIGLNNTKAIENIEFESDLLVEQKCEAILTYRIVAGPEWLSINSSSGKLYGVPVSDEVGERKVTIEAIDQFGVGVSQSLFIEVEPIETLQEVAGIWAESSVCSGEDASLSIFYNGTAPWQFKITNGNDTTIVTNIAEYLFTLTVKPVHTTEYKLLSVIDGKSDNVKLASNTALVSVKRFSQMQMDACYAIEGVDFSSKITVNNICFENLQYKLLDAPPWLQLNELNGLIYGKPGMNDIGSSIIIAKVSNQFDYQLIDTFSIEVKRLTDLLSFNIKNSVVCTKEDIEIDIGYSAIAPWGFSLSNAIDTITVSDLQTVSYSTTIPAVHPGEIYLLTFNYQGVEFYVNRSVGSVTIDTLKIGGLTSQLESEGSTFNTQVWLSSQCTNDLEYEILNAPLWLRVDPLTGLITGVPATNDIGSFNFELKVQDKFGNFDIQNVSINISADIDERASTAIFPNPFSGSTVITYRLHQPGAVNVVTLNSRGQKVYEITRQEDAAGLKKIIWDGGKNPSGLYYVQIQMFNSNRETISFIDRVIKLD